MPPKAHDACELAHRPGLVAKVVERVGDDEPVEGVVGEGYRLRGSAHGGHRASGGDVAQHLGRRVEHGHARVEGRAEASGKCARAAADVE